jgi:hypothetical protein
MFNKNNTGDRNKVNLSNGFFNTIEGDEILIFNKPYSYNKFYTIDKPKWIYFKLTEWISAINMWDAEKKSNPSYKAYYNQVNTCKDETKQDKEEHKTIVLDGITYKLVRI